MANKQLLTGTTFMAICFFVFTLYHLPMAAFSRSLHTETNNIISTNSILNVASSIQQTLNSISPNQNSFRIQSQSSINVDSLVLPLHNRGSIQQHRHKDYKSLTQSRLERDSIRVKSIQKRLDLAINRITKSNLETKVLEGPVVSGTSQGSGEYFSRIGIGNPAKKVYVVLDTGSDVSWIQCQPCDDCYHQSDPIFNPNSSSSYAPLTCDSSQCKALDISECSIHQCIYEVSYGDGSYTVGHFATETVTLGEASVANVAIGCGHSNQGLFVGAAGLLGLGGGDLAFPAQINTTSFSYCLVDRDSAESSTLEFNSKMTSDAVTVPLVRNSELATFYYLQLTGISVSGKLLSLPPTSFQMDEIGDGGVIIDSGTAITRLEIEVYNALREAFVNGTKHLPTASAFALFDTCYNLTGMSSVAVPSMALHFPAGKAVTLPAKNYMIPVDDSGTFCLAFAPTASSLSIIGNVQQQGTRVTFDIGKSLVGFATNKC